MKRRLCVMIVLIMIIATIGGCGKKSATAKEYVQAYMDNLYLGENSQFAKFSKYDKNECKDIRDAKINKELEDVISNLNNQSDISDETKKKFKEAMDSAFKKAVYEVSGCKKQGDYYTIEITYQQAEIFQTSMQGLYSELLKKGQNVTEDKTLSILSDKLLETCSKEVTYKDKNTLTIVVKRNEDEYNIPADMLKKIEKSLFDISDNKETK